MKLGNFLFTSLIAVMTGPFSVAVSAATAEARPSSDDACQGYTAWTVQSNPRSDPTGYYNVAYPEMNATYWVTALSGAPGSTVSIKGRFPKARYMALQVYDDNRNVLGAINDVTINPDAGQNNPFRTGSDQGTYTVTLVFGRAPSAPPPNTLYTAGLKRVSLFYRIYYSNNPDDLTGGTTNPVLPTITVGTSVYSSCPPRPILTPEDSTVWGRLDNGDWNGQPPDRLLPVNNPPTWTISVTNGNTPFYPSADNSYMASTLSRAFLSAPYAYDLVVIRFRAPTYPNTQAGEPPYLASTTRQVRFWSVCQDDPITTGVMRCLPDNQVPLLNGYATVVLSDPSKRPPDSTLALYGATWMAWGALQPGDRVYDLFHMLKGNENGVYYQGTVLYRQTMANPTFAASIKNISQLPRDQWPAAMGEYFPVIGYCTSEAFTSQGTQCIGQ